MKTEPPCPKPSDLGSSAPSAPGAPAGLSRRRFVGVATGAATLLVQAIASRRGFAASSFSAVGSLDYHPPTARQFPFDGSIFPYGAIHFSTLPHWQYYLQPIAQWRPWLERDLRQMKDLGLNTVVAHIDWYDAEPAQGGYDFSRSDVVVELAEKVGLYALLWPWPELEPDWLGRAFPDALWVGDDGLKVGSACWDHPQVRAAAGNFIRSTIERYKSSPAVLAWDIAAEPGLWISGDSLVRERGQARTYCYCPYTKARYRDWLKKQYGDLNRLNEFWATYHQHWDEIEPLRAGIFERAQAPWVDWRQFMLWNVADFQHFKADVARKADPTRPVTCHIGGLGSGYAYHCADEYQISEFMDVFGLSFFPYWMMHETGEYEPSFGSLALDGIRSLGRGKPMWVEELQGGPSVSGLHFHSPTPGAEDIRIWVWQSIAHGAKGVYFWNWRPELTGIEASGFGLVEADGSPTPRARAAGELGKLLQKHGRRFILSRPWPAEIAILHSPRTSVLAFGEGEEGLPLQSVRGVYRALWRHQLPVDFIVNQQLAEGIDLSKYKVIYLPLAYTLSREEGAWLRRFVAAGGTLVGDLWCGLKDERAMIYEQMPGAGLAEVFGCHMQELVPTKSSWLTTTEPVKFGCSLPAGSRFEVTRYRARMVPQHGCSIAGEFEDGSPGILVNQFEKGKAAYIPALIGGALDEKGDEGLAKLLADLALWAGVQPVLRLEKIPTQIFVEARLLEGEKEDTVVLLNHSAEKVSIRVRFPLPRHRSAAFSDLLADESLPVKQESGAVILETSLDPRAVKVWSVQTTGA